MKQNTKQNFYKNPFRLLASDHQSVKSEIVFDYQVVILLQQIFTPFQPERKRYK